MDHLQGALMPRVSCVRCPSCSTVVAPVAGEMRACRCSATFIARKPDGRLYVAGPEGIELVPTMIPYVIQLELPL